MLDLVEAAPNRLAEWLANGAHQMAHRRNLVIGGATSTRQHILGMSEGRCRFSVADPRKFTDFSACEVKLGGTTIRYLRWDGETDCEKITDRPVSRTDYALHCVLRGELDAIHGDERVHVRTGQVMIKATGGHTIKRWHGSCEMLIVFVTHDALRRMIADGLPEGQSALDLAPLTVVDLARVATLARFIATVVADLGETSSSFSEPRIAAQAERTLHMLFLKSFGHDAAPSNVAPFYMRRAERFLRDHLAEDIDLARLAQECGVSLRTLQYGFRAYRNSSPAKYLKGLRLAAAHAALECSAGVKIGEIAARCGYRSVAQFSRDYRAQFAESPSEAASRALLLGN